MRTLFGILLAVLCLVGVVMVGTAGDAAANGKLILSWATDDTPIRRAQIQLFNQLNPDLEVRMDPTNRDANKVVIQSLGGVGPDVFDIGGTMLPVYVNAGIALDITDSLREMGFDVEREVWPAAKSLYVYKDRVYGVPLNLDSLGVFYNRKMLREAGLPDLPQLLTWDELIAAARKLTVRNRDGSITRFGMLYWWNWRDFFALSGASVFDDRGVPTIDTPEARRAVKLMVDLCYRYRVAPTTAEQNSMASTGGWGSGNEGRFLAGKTAIVLGPRYFVGHFRRAPGFEVGVARLPLFPGGATPLRGRVVAVNSKGKHRDEALRFVKFVMSGEYNRQNNDLADGLGPVMKFTSEPSFVKNPEFPDERDNITWRNALLAAKPDETSPFLTNTKVDEAVMFQLDLVSQGRKDPEAALRDAQIAAMKSLRQNLETDPGLAARFQTEVGQP